MRHPTKTYAIAVGSVLLIFITMTLVFIPDSVSIARADAGMPDIPGVTLIESTSEHILLEINIPDFSIRQSTAEGQACQLVEVDGFAKSDTSGHPELPVIGTLLGTPADTIPTIEIREAELKTAPGVYKICQPRSQS